MFRLLANDVLDNDRAEVELIKQEVIGMAGFEIEGSKGIGGEVRQVARDNGLASSPDRHRDHLPIIGIRQRDRFLEVLPSRHHGVIEGDLHVVKSPCNCRCVDISDDAFVNRNADFGGSSLIGTCSGSLSCTGAVNRSGYGRTIEELWDDSVQASSHTPSRCSTVRAPNRASSKSAAATCWAPEMYG